MTNFPSPALSQITPVEAINALGESYDWKISNLKINWVLFFIQLYWWEKHQQKFIDAEFYNSKIGPVMPEYYRAYSVFGDDYVRPLHPTRVPLPPPAVKTIENFARFTQERYVNDLIVMLQKTTDAINLSENTARPLPLAQVAEDFALKFGPAASIKDYQNKLDKAAAENKNDPAAKALAQALINNNAARQRADLEYSIFLSFAFFFLTGQLISWGAPDHVFGISTFATYLFSGVCFWRLRWVRVGCRRCYYYIRFRSKPKSLLFKS